MDVDKILPSSSTLGWHRVEVKGEVQTRKGLWWIPRHPETRKGVLSDEMLRGVAKNQRSEDSRIGQPFELLLNSPFTERHGQLLNFVTSNTDEDMMKVLFQFFDPLHHCFTFPDYQLVPTLE